MCADTEDEMKGWINAIVVSIKGSSKQAKEMTVDDFQLLNTIGKGSFGKVLQVKKKDNGQIYAMKILNKKNIIDNNEVNQFRSCTTKPKYMGVSFQKCNTFVDTNESEPTFFPFFFSPLSNLRVSFQKFGIRQSFGWITLKEFCYEILRVRVE